MKSLLQRLTDHTSRRNRAATVLLRENHSLAATIQDQAQAIADLTTELRNMTHERDRSERFLMEARNANTRAGERILVMALEIEGLQQQVAARDIEVNEQHRELVALRKTSESRRMMLLAQAGMS